MNETTQAVLTFGGFLFSIIGTWIGVSKFYQDSLKEKKAQIQQIVQERSEANTKEYAAQRDFAHLKRNLEQLQHGQLQIMSELESRIQQVEDNLEKADRRLIKLTAELNLILRQALKGAGKEILSSSEEDG